MPGPVTYCGICNSVHPLGPCPERSPCCSHCAEIVGLLQQIRDRLPPLVFHPVVPHEGDGWSKGCMAPFFEQEPYVRLFWGAGDVSQTMPELRAAV